MLRLRITCLTAAVLLALAALTLNSLAQPPGRGGDFGGGFGGRRGGGGGFGGPGGGFGGRGGSLLQLASNPAVQEDLKLKDKQKAQIKSLSDKYEEHSRALRSQMGGGPNGRGPGGPPQPGGQGGGQNGNGQNADNNAGGGGNFGGGQGGGGGNFGGGQGQDPNAQGGRGGRGNRGNRNRNGQGVPEDPAVVAQRNEQRQMAREAMNELRQSAEASLGRILDKGQAVRLKQIQLQLEGPTVVLREDIMDKLQIDEAQVELIREVMGENREAGQAMRRSRFEAMKTAFARLNPDAAARNQNDGAGGNGGGGDNGNGNGNNDQNGGRRGGRGNFNPEAFRKVMEDPQVKAQMDDLHTQQQKLDAQFAYSVNKVLMPRQRAMFKRMLGAPFDRSKMVSGSPWGRRGGNPATAKGTANTQAKSSDADDDDDSPTAKPTAANPAKAKPAVAKRKSLRELRGEPSSTDD